MKPLGNLPSLEAVIQELGKLPGIGPKSATGLGYHLVSLPSERVKRLAELLQVLPDRIGYCSACGMLTESDPCVFCREPSRDQSLLCVVEESLDALSIEKSGAFTGLYHVLGGTLSPLDGIGPAELRVKELLERLKSDEIKEVILATNPSVEGEATASYLRNLIADLGSGIQLSRFARGLPIGGDLVYTDEETLALALQTRKPMEGE
ncbi:MAG: recombination protein RecR [Candidatus Omnitrophica bacterium]|nr:recombination protein RecR [Candidatus Omnitrophota bacterium]